MLFVCTFDNTRVTLYDTDRHKLHAYTLDDFKTYIFHVSKQLEATDIDYGTKYVFKHPDMLDTLSLVLNSSGNIQDVLVPNRSRAINSIGNIARLFDGLYYITGVVLGISSYMYFEVDSYNFTDTIRVGGNMLSVLVDGGEFIVCWSAASGYYLKDLFGTPSILLRKVSDKELVDILKDSERARNSLLPFCSTTVRKKLLVAM